ncbi:MAG: dynamin family protein [Actinomycetota bacterium]
MSSEIATISALEQLTAALRGTGLALDIGDVVPARSARDELADQIGDYLVPRLKRLDAPLLAVLGGSTGSGKSTITNTLIGQEVSPSGVLRPTTRAPVLICNPQDEPWFSGGDVLPDLPRVTTSGGPAGSAGTGGSILQVVAVPDLEPGLAIIDAPDIDSVEEANRDLATQLLAAADLWLFATTAVRYADAVPWDFLRQAEQRGTALAIIINRIPAGASGEIVPHLGTMLAEAGLADVTVFPIEQQDQLNEGMLNAAAVAELRTLLIDLATDADRRGEVVRKTLDGALDSIGTRVGTVLDAAMKQDEAVAELRAAARRSHGDAEAAIERDLSSGNLLRGEVLDRWQELIGTAELMQAVQSRITWIRDRIGAFFTGRTAATAEVQGEITSTLEQLLIDHADTAAATTGSAWRGMPGGRQLLGEDRSLDRASEEFRSTVATQIRAWQDDILNLVRERGAGKRTTARILAFGVNSIGVALMIVLFSQTGGITGGEIAIGAGTAGLSQTLLSALFGEQAVRELATEARRLLADRVSALLAAEQARFDGLLDDLAATDVSKSTEAADATEAGDFTGATKARETTETLRDALRMYERSR